MSGVRDVNREAGRAAGRTPVNAAQRGAGVPIFLRLLKADNARKKIGGTAHP